MTASITDGIIHKEQALRSQLNHSEVLNQNRLVIRRWNIFTIRTRAGTVSLRQLRQQQQQQLKQQQPVQQ